LRHAFAEKVELKGRIPQFTGRGDGDGMWVADESW
jgi:hypothetical protein